MAASLSSKGANCRIITRSLQSEPTALPVAPVTDRGIQLFRQDNPSFDAIFVRERLDELARAAASHLDGAKTARERVTTLNAFFFGQEGFTADVDLENPDNLFPDAVIRRRRGYCTGLAWVYAAVAEKLGIPVYAVATPRHLFLRYDDGETRINIETTERGREVSDAAYRQRYRIPESSVDQGVFLQNLDADGFLSQLANNLGVLHSRAEEYGASAAAYEQALQLDPRNPAAHHNLAKDRMRQGRLEEAIADFSRALELNPNDVSSLNNRGVCRFRLGDVQGGIADFEAALAIDPRSAEARHNLDALIGDATRD